MKAKILYTDGQRTVELFWLKHTGTDVYCGHPQSSVKRSYHASGKLHTKDGPTEIYGEWIAPLKDLQGAFHLMTIAFTSSRAFVRAARAELEFTRTKLDTALYIDARAIPEGMLVNVAVGLLEPGNLAALSFLAALPNLKQILVSTAVSPWVFAGITWPPGGHVWPV